jgi:GTP-binding protein HflX
MTTNVQNQNLERTILVHLETNQLETQEDFDEFYELAIAAGANVLAKVKGTLSRIDAKYFIGSGKAEEIRQQVQLTGAQLVLFNHNLSPAQERNLERLLKCSVLSRTSLILDIFAQRARTFEGKLQVELAQLQYLSTRLIRGWTHLERQKGGIGLKGPGETQLEVDRRLIRQRIKYIQKQLEKVRKQRLQSRKARTRAHIPVVSLVGYTNAGKSTVFNVLTQDNVFVADQPFATLDPTFRRTNLTPSSPAIIADTVGFIRHLPHDLIEAFNATLEETQEATLLLHIIDASHPNRRDNIEQVEAVLTHIHADKVPRLEVYNKIDLLEVEDNLPKIEYDVHDNPQRIWISALEHTGIELLKKTIAKLLYQKPVYRNLCLSPNQSELRSKLYQIEAVQNEYIDEEGNFWLKVKLFEKDLGLLDQG